MTRPGGIVAASQLNFENGMLTLASFWGAVAEAVGTNHAREAAANCMNVDYADDKALARLWKQAGFVEVEKRLQGIEMGSNLSMTIGRRS